MNTVLNIKENINENSMETVYEKDKNMRTDNNQKKEDKRDETESFGISFPDDQKFQLKDRFEMNKDFFYAKKGDFEKSAFASPKKGSSLTSDNSK